MAARVIPGSTGEGMASLGSSPRAIGVRSWLSFTMKALETEPPARWFDTENQSASPA